jgi:hypothetical protein
MEDCIEHYPTKSKKTQKRHNVTFDTKLSSDTQDTQENHTTDTLSNYSGSYLSKHSPEYSSGEYDDKSIKSKIPPIIRKGIHKYYEPIIDCGQTFKYEDNPNEYKKARK